MLSRRFVYAMPSLGDGEHPGNHGWEAMTTVDALEATVNTLFAGGPEPLSRASSAECRQTCGSAGSVCALHGWDLSCGVGAIT